MTAICKCDRCGKAWSCAATDEPDVNATVLTGEQQECPDCGSDDFTIIDHEWPEPEYGDCV